MVTVSTSELEQYLTVSDAAEFLGVSPATLRNWDKNGKLIAYRHPVNDYRLYKKTDLAGIFPIKKNVDLEFVEKLPSEPESDCLIQEKSGLYNPKNNLNNLTSKEWIPETVSVWIQKGLGAKHPDTKIERQHPAPFSFTDVSRLIRFFTKEGQTVLDPFVGVGSTLKACALTSRNGIGFELNATYAKLAQERLDTELQDMFTNKKQLIKIGDSRKLVKELEENSIDFVVTSPPYWNILHKEDHKANQERKQHNLDTKYSNDSKDLGNISNYEDFIIEVSNLIGACAIPLKYKKYMAIIVSDFRDKSKYIMFHAHLADSLLKYELELKGIKILHQKHKRIFPYGYPYAYVPNIHHQYILILQNMKIK